LLAPASKKVTSRQMKKVTLYESHKLSNTTSTHGKNNVVYVFR